MSLTLPLTAPRDGNRQPAENNIGLKPLPCLFSLDVLRGLAVTGALLVSIWLFGGFSNNIQTGILTTGKGWNYRLYSITSILLDGKMRAVISIVFGACIILFLSKENNNGKLAAPDLFARRQLWLMVFGLINGLVFLNTGDILFHLGVFGLMFFPLARLSTRGLVIVAIIMTLIYSGKNLWNFSENRDAYHKYVTVTALEKKLIAKNKLKDSTAKKDLLSRHQMNDKSAWEGILAGTKFDSKKNDEAYKAMRIVSYASVWNYMVPALQRKESRWAYTFGIWDFAGMMLLGMALFKSGFFTWRLSTAVYWLLSIAGISLGILSGYYRLQLNQTAIADYTQYVTLHQIPFDLFFPFERLLLAVGYCSAIMLLIRLQALKFIWKAFAATGRMALTNYFVQSIVCTIFFAGFGMGYFGMLKQYQLYFFAAELSIVQIVFSVFWLRFYQAGPAEWLMRCLMYGKLLPNKIQKNLAAEAGIPAFI